MSEKLVERIQILISEIEKFIVDNKSFFETPDFALPLNLRGSRDPRTKLEMAYVDLIGLKQNILEINEATKNFLKIIIYSDHENNSLLSINTPSISNLKPMKETNRRPLAA